MDYKTILLNTYNLETARLSHFDATGYGFFAIVRSKKTNDDVVHSSWCDKWVTEFSAHTHTNWIVRYTYPSAKRYEYRKVFKCQLNGFDKVKEKIRVGCLNRNKQCNATIDFLFKKINRNTIRNDKHLKNGLNVSITIMFQHSHHLAGAEALSYLRLAPNVRDTFLRYFNEGMTYTSARKYHETKLKECHEAEAANLPLVLANIQINPTERQIKHLYERWSKFRTTAMKSKPEPPLPTSTILLSETPECSQPSTSTSSTPSADPFYKDEPSCSQAGEPDIASSTLELLPEQTEQPDLRPRPFKGSKDNRIYCRLCLKPAYKNSLTPLSVVDFNYPGKSETFRKKKLEKVEEINKMLKFCLPFYDSLTFNPVICSICLGRLKVCYEFSKECLKSQRLIEKYADTYSATERVINLSEMIETKFRLPDDENMSDIETDVFDIPKVTSSSGNISQKRQYSNEDRPPAKRRKDYHESHEEDSQSSSNEDTSNIKIEPDDDDSCALKMEPSDDDFTEDVPHDVLKSYIIDPNKIDETTMIKVEPNYIDSSDFIKNEPLDDLHVKNKVYTGRTDIGTDIEKQSSHLQEMKNVPLVTTKVPPSLPVGPVFPKVESSLEDTTSDVIK